MRLEQQMKWFDRLNKAIWVLVVVGAVGWCMNIYKLTQLDFEGPYKAEVLRVAGLLPPVGAIVGYLSIDD